MVKARTLLHIATLAPAVLLCTWIARAGDQAFSPVEVCDEGLYPGASALGVFDILGSFFPKPGKFNLLTCGIGQNKVRDENDDVLIFFDDQSDSGVVACWSNELADDYSLVVRSTAVRGCDRLDGCPLFTTFEPSWKGSGRIRFRDITHGGTYFTTLNCEVPSATAIRSLTIDEQ